MRRTRLGPSVAREATKLGIVVAFLSVYVIWGSTYLAIRLGVQEMPPFLMAGLRWLVAGGLLYAWRRASGDARPSLLNWREASIVGIFLIVGGNGIVSFAAQWVPSGLTALLIAIVPVWIALITFGQTKVRPAPRVFLGIGLGVVGVALLAGPAVFGGGWGTLLVLVASLSWATGSMYSRGAKLPSSSLLGAAMQMIVGGVVLSLAGLASGEAARVDLAAVSWVGWTSLAFLVFFGSIVAYSAYVWLLQVVRPELVATYAFVNPVVAVILGWWIADESFGIMTALAAALIIVAVAIVVTTKAPPRAPSQSMAKA